MANPEPSNELTELVVEVRIMMGRLSPERPMACFLYLMLTIVASGAEKLDRGLVAVQRQDRAVFVSWRLLDSDPNTTSFMLTRRNPAQPEKLPIILAEAKSYTLTNFLDKSVQSDPSETTCLYELFVCAADRCRAEPAASAAVTLADEPEACVKIPLQGGYDCQKVGIGDLDGDGAFEYLIEQPNFNTDPYQQPGYWKKSPTTYKLEAYRLDGTMMWRYDMGWSIEAGIWYSPWIVYDVDGDGKAEVYCKAGEGDPRDKKGRVQTGPEFLVKLDGQTGRVLTKTPWLSRNGFSDYNYYSRNFLAVAYLDGSKPSLIMQRGTYELIKTQALDKDFNQIWYWESTQEDKRHSGQGFHGLISADIDDDGRDELVIGAAVLDDNGRGLWTLEMGHPDVCHVADIDPDNPGLEVFYGFETPQQTDGICVVDAKTGRKLWALKEPTYHIHEQGMVGDILAEHPGMEVYAGEADYQKRWLYSANGKLIQFRRKGELYPRPVWWDADPQKEVLYNCRIYDWPDKLIEAIHTQEVLIGDCLGDYREEIIAATEGELRIYTTTIPASDRRPSLMQNRQYRLGIAAQTMGYYYPAQLGK